MSSLGLSSILSVSGRGQFSVWAGSVQCLDWVCPVSCQCLGGVSSVSSLGLSSVLSVSGLGHFSVRSASVQCLLWVSSESSLDLQCHFVQCLFSANFGSVSV